MSSVSLSSEVGSEGGVDSEASDLEGGIPDFGSVEQVCEGTPSFSCGQGIDCSNSDCGDPFSPFDDDGCLRRSCPCADDELCITPAQWGGCVSSSTSCSETDNGCECTSDPDCGGSHCIPADEVPEVPCSDFDSENDCGDAQCMWFAGVRSVFEADACTCDTPLGICVESNDYGELPVPATYFRLDAPEQAVTLASGWSSLPYGLGVCDGDGPVGACTCGSLVCE